MNRRARGSARRITSTDLPSIFRSSRFTRITDLGSDPRHNFLSLRIRFRPAPSRRMPRAHLDAFAKRRTLVAPLKTARNRSDMFIKQGDFGLARAIYSFHPSFIGL